MGERLAHCKKAMGKNLRRTARDAYEDATRSEKGVELNKTIQRKENSQEH